jgi:hypothetical protein
MGIAGSLLIALVLVDLATTLLYVHKNLREPGSYNNIALSGAVGLYGGTIIALVNVGLKSLE